MCVCVCVCVSSQIFEMDEAKRIDIPGIRAHPWYNTPMPQVYEQALDALVRDQEETAARVKAAVLHVSVYLCVRAHRGVCMHLLAPTLVQRGLRCRRALRVCA